MSRKHFIPYIVGHARDIIPIAVTTCSQSTSHLSRDQAVVRSGLLHPTGSTKRRYTDRKYILLSSLSASTGRVVVLRVVDSSRTSSLYLSILPSRCRRVLALLSIEDARESSRSTHSHLGSRRIYRFVGRWSISQVSSLDFHKR